MNIKHHFLTSLLVLLSAGANACVLRIGYTTQNAPPYFIGTDTIPATPGATVDLLNEMAAAAGCKTELVRLPTARLLLAVNAGQIDATALASPPAGMQSVVYPRAADGKPDPARGLQHYTVIIVRAADRAAAERDLPGFLRQRRVGVSHGVSFIGELRAAGLTVDDGAADARRNFDKLKRHRVDAVAMSLNVPSDMDEMLAREHGKDLARLEQPWSAHSLWLMVNKDYYGSHGAAVEEMWRWMGSKGRKRLPLLLKKYEALPPQGGGSAARP
ncbi:substrate-binding periplasmic protein [Rugamonas aquatica]|uniref:Solute-binding protein family 3/N-terminal domain-containing protein n=1 Tax=Rugamonas aquatica TaxID=2743357 RepID=A0A6A7N9M0_9BURK|nr:hypothetical protein [Rugamonas aquatica]MQA41598.1 hypothetical protein [Rugamonas aquatica]